MIREKLILEVDCWDNGNGERAEMEITDEHLRIWDNNDDHHVLIRKHEIPRIIAWLRDNVGEEDYDDP